MVKSLGNENVTYVSTTFDLSVICIEYTLIQWMQTLLQRYKNKPFVLLTSTIAFISVLDLLLGQS